MALEGSHTVTSATKCRNRAHIPLCQGAPPLDRASEAALMQGRGRGTHGRGSPGHQAAGSTLGST